MGRSLGTSPPLRYAGGRAMVTRKNAAQRLQFHSMMLAALAVAAHLVAAQPLAGRVPRMTAPVVHIRAVKQLRLSSLPWLNRLGHLQNAVGSGFVIDSSGGNALILTNEHVV